nr:MAG TPA: hypothetical protein [Caudoviricetes sp.]
MAKIKITKTEVKNFYNSCLENGELFLIFPEATGVWEKDKKPLPNIMKKIKSLKL